MHNALKVGLTTSGINALKVNEFLFQSVYQWKIQVNGLKHKKLIFT